MNWSWLLSVGEKILLGAIGGFIAIYFSRKRFLSERWWDKRYDVYLETLEILRRLERSLFILSSAIYQGKIPEINDEIKITVKEYEALLSDLISIQHKHVLLTPTTVHQRIMVLYSALTAFDPEFVLRAGETTEAERKEIFDLAIQSKKFVSGALGETTYEARDDLAIGSTFGWRKKYKGSILGMSIDGLKKEVKEIKKRLTKSPPSAN